MMRRPAVTGTGPFYNHPAQGSTVRAARPADPAVTFRGVGKPVEYGGGIAFAKDNKQTNSRTAGFQQEDRNG
jgi:hypothetical protein